MLANSRGSMRRTQNVPCPHGVQRILIGSGWGYASEWETTDRIFFCFFSGSLMRRNQMIISLTGYYTLKFMHGSYSILMKCCGVSTKELMTNGPGVGWEEVGCKPFSKRPRMVIQQWWKERQQRSISSVCLIQSNMHNIHSRQIDR